MESRIRQLVMKLELVDTIDVAHPFVKGFERTYHCASGEEVNAVARGEIPEAVSKRSKEEIEGQEGGGTVYATSFFIGLEIQPKKGKSVFIASAIALISHSAGAVGPRKLDISYPTTEFTKMVKMWDNFDDDRMGIIVRHIKRFVCGLFHSLELYRSYTVEQHGLARFSF